MSSLAQPLQRRRQRAGPVRWLAGGLLLVSVLVVVSAALGAVTVPLWRLGPALWAASADPQDALWRQVVIELRLPRIVLGLLAGAALAVCGAAMQALFRNPLAEPGLVGVSLGGATGAVVAIVLGAQTLPAVAVPAFVGSLVATLAAYRLGGRHDGVAHLLLAGVAINAICASVIGLFTFQANDVQLCNLTFWNLGSLAGAQWTLLAWLAPWVLGWSIWLMRDWRAMNALLLGEREARHLGYAPQRLQRRIVFGAALLVGPLVAVTGAIAFVGLVVPHLVRLGVGADHRWLLPLSGVFGALALLLADTLARVVVMPAELPIGIVTSLVGGPFLLWLLMRERR
ncbi:FecCD family ABC transporter permease [Caldimonas manganoxidans]|uniref:FecCD family ABC transporter permease n=1 Tax=Caldimonas manganoxidans TaxID=196015 RepID=UPI00037A56D6